MNNQNIEKVTGKVIDRIIDGLKKKIKDKRQKKYMEREEYYRKEFWRTIKYLIPMILVFWIFCFIFIKETIERLFFALSVTITAAVYLGILLLNSLK